MTEKVVKLTYHKEGLKLGGFLSLNVNPKYNDFCNTCHKQKDSICKECYAFYMVNRYKRLYESTKFNSLKLSENILSVHDLKSIVYEIYRKKDLTGFRFNSLGELINDIHIINIQSLSYELRQVMQDIPVTLWTKRTNLLFSIVDKPFYNIIESCKKLNRCIIPTNCDDRTLHTFNVYDSEEKMNKDISTLNKWGINTRLCLSKCKECMICYPAPGTLSDRYAIFELTKKAQRKKALLKGGYYEG